MITMIVTPVHNVYYVPAVSCFISTSFSYCCPFPVWLSVSYINTSSNMLHHLRALAVNDPFNSILLVVLVVKYYIYRVISPLCSFSITCVLWAVWESAGQFWVCLIWAIFIYLIPAFSYSLLTSQTNSKYVSLSYAHPPALIRPKFKWSSSLVGYHQLHTVPAYTVPYISIISIILHHAAHL